MWVLLRSSAEAGREMGTLSDRMRTEQHRFSKFEIIKGNIDWSPLSIKFNKFIFLKLNYSFILSAFILEKTDIVFLNLQNF